MKRLLFIFAIAGMAALMPRLASHAQSGQVAAEKAAREIVQALAEQKYKLVWEEKVSGWFKKQVTQDAFLSNMSMGRVQLVSLQSSALVSSEHASRDPTTGYEGDIYAFVFRDKYSVGEFYERIVVTKDADGQYRLSGIFGSPVPK